MTTKTTTVPGSRRRSAGQTPAPHALRIGMVALCAGLLAACGKSSADDSKPSSESKSDTKAADGKPAEGKAGDKPSDKPSSGDITKLGIPECDAYIERASGCLKDHRALKTMTDKWREALSRGESKDKVKGACEMAAKLLKCP